MSGQFTGRTGTFLIGGAEARPPRSLPGLLMAPDAVGAVLALVPPWVCASRVR